MAKPLTQETSELETEFNLDIHAHLREILYSNWGKIRQQLSFTWRQWGCPICAQKINCLMYVKKTISKIIFSAMLISMGTMSYLQAVFIRYRYEQQKTK